MSSFFCSDLHGEYDLFRRLLDACKITDEDVVYILGDMIDKGKGSFRLLDFIMRQKNFVPLCGNHEEILKQLYEDKMMDYTGNNDEEILEKIRAFYPADGKDLTWEMIDYVDTLPYYIEKNNFICVHAGLQLNPDKTVVPLPKQSPDYFVYDRKFKETSVVPQTKKTVLFGHTPCSYENGTGKFIKTPKQNAVGNKLNDYAKIRLDTGVAYTRMLGMLRAEDMQEIYVKE